MVIVSRVIREVQWLTNSRRVFNKVNGKIFNENWISEFSKSNFYYLKGVAENLLNQLNILNIKYEVTNDELFEYKLTIFNNKNNIGFIGELNSNYTKGFSIDDKVHLLNLDLDVIKFKSLNVKFQESSKFPSSRRDLSMILDDNITFEAIKDLAFKLENKILKDVNLFDEFKGKNIGDDKKSFAVSFTFNDSKKTLTDKLIDKIMLKLSDKYKTDLGAVIRDK